MKKENRNKSSIARRFIFYIVLFSSFVTLVITAFQLYRDYKIDLNLIHKELEQIESVHLDSLSAALWTSNSKLLQTSIEGILKIRDIQYIEIRDEQKLWNKAGEIIGDNNIERIYPMTYRHRGKDINIGQLIVNVSLNGVYQRLYDTIWVVLVSNAVKTFLVVLFIYFLFYNLIARHLFAISDFSEKHHPLLNNKPLVLERNDKYNDEFDVVVRSINEMHTRLHEKIHEIDQQKKYLSQTLDSIGDAVITTDDRGKVTRLNPVAEALTGWTNEEAEGQSVSVIFSIVNASTGEAIANPVEKVLATGEIVYLSNHTTLISKDGQKFHIADSAAPIRDDEKILGMVLVFNDVTEQYKIREALKESEKKLRLIYAQVPGIVYQFKIDTQGNRSFPYVSPAVEQHIGVPADELMKDAEKWFELTHPDDNAELERSIVESMKNLSVWEWEGRFIKNNGEVVWLNGISTPERTDDGSTLWHGVIVNVTERVQADETIRRTQKMDALGKLTGGIAHDYNNMLGVVIGYADILKDQLDDKPVLQQYAEKIGHAGERGAKLTKKLLSFSKNKTTDAESLNINTVLKYEQHMLEKTLTSRIKLEFKLSEELWPVHLDESEFEDALLNICINAMHATKGNGELILETCNVRVNEVEAKVLELTAGDYVKFSLRDTGKGMSEEIKEKIFDPFYSTKGEKGTGLGLSQVYGFVSRSGGAIKVESVIDEGTEFVLFFPRYLDENTRIKSSATEIKKEADGKETILVVDDEVDLLALTCEILIQHNYRVFHADNAEYALEILQREKIDLLLSDIIMPDMDGYTLASIVMEKYPHVRIQLASGFPGEHDVENVDEALSENILRKPYNSTALLARVQDLLSRNS